MRNLEKKMDAMARCCLAETLADRKAAMDELRELLEEKNVQDVPDDIAAEPRTIENVIDDVLLELGVPCHIKGHPYLVTALGVVVENPGYINAIMKQLHPVVAKKYGTTPSRVERSIRHAIDVTWERGDPDILMRYFGNTISADRGKPTNREFIARVANVVRQQLSA